MKIDAMCECGQEFELSLNENLFLALRPDARPWIVCPGCGGERLL